ncbi:MAG: DUF2235 domain-containing protein [Hyphomicrobiales bacterium]
MGRNILVFSDGTGQIGGLQPDQRLSNVYKLFRAMRPDPQSPIDPAKQVAFYDAGLGVGEIREPFFKRVRSFLASALGAGIDENVIDCYEFIIGNYRPGDRVLLFGFSRGAYTVRAVANVMNLCGVPTKMSDGSPVPQTGEALRKIASDAVLYVYNHGAGKKRGDEPYYSQREEKGRRFRNKYGSAPLKGENVQGNVQPTFVGVFDTVAALDSAVVGRVLLFLIYAIAVAAIVATSMGAAWWLVALLWLATGVVGFFYGKLLLSQFKYFSPEGRTLKFKNPGDWWQIWQNGHRAVWNSRHFDAYLDSDVQHARHALAIDEHRAKFPRVIWGSSTEAEKTVGRQPTWLKQVWFAGCHSDIGGSYPEHESRLSDIALDWMVDEVRECVPEVQINEALLNRWPDPRGLQHDQTYMPGLEWLGIKWKRKIRAVPDGGDLHPSVITRLQAEAAPIEGMMVPYRPPQLIGHVKVRQIPGFAEAASEQEAKA